MFFKCRWLAILCVACLRSVLLLVSRVFVIWTYVNCVCDLLRFNVAALVFVVLVWDAVTADAAGNVVRLRRDVELVLPAAVVPSAKTQQPLPLFLGFWLNTRGGVKLFVFVCRTSVVDRYIVFNIAKLIDYSPSRKRKYPPLPLNWKLDQLIQSVTSMLLIHRYLIGQRTNTERKHHYLHDDDDRYHLCLCLCCVCVPEWVRPRPLPSPIARMLSKGLIF